MLGAVWTLSLLSQGKSLSSPETQRRYSRLIERGEPPAYLRGAGDRKVRNDHRRTENHITLIQQESLVMITASKLAIAIAVAGPLAAATVGQSFATSLPTSAVSVKAAAPAGRAVSGV